MLSNKDYQQLGFKGGFKNNHNDVNATFEKKVIDKRNNDKKAIFIIANQFNNWVVVGEGEPDANKTRFSGHINTQEELKKLLEQLDFCDVSQYVNYYYLDHHMEGERAFMHNSFSGAVLQVLITTSSNNQKGRPNLIGIHRISETGFKSRFLSLINKPDYMDKSDCWGPRKQIFNLISKSEFLKHFKKMLTTLLQDCKTHTLII